MKPLDLTQKPLLGSNLIEASAGTGKTFSIANLYLHFLLNGKSVQQILVVTFTEAATKELRERIRENVNLARKVYLGLEKDDVVASILERYDAKAIRQLDQAVLNFDQSAIFTIHGFCQRILLEHAFESSSSFDAELLKDDSMLIEEVVNDFWRREIYPLSEIELNYLELSRDELMTLCRQLEQDPELVLLDKVSEVDWEDAKHEYVIRLKQCNEAWTLFEQHSEEIFSRLYSGALNGTSYRKSSWPKKVEALRSCLTKAQYDEDILNYFGFQIELKCKKGQSPPKHDFFELCKNLVEENWPDMNKLFSLYLKHKFCSQLPLKLAEVKKRLQVMTFSDLITQLYTALKSEGETGRLHYNIRDKYHAALVDEFQDTDPKQYSIFQSLFGKTKEHYFYMIGDPKQSIYAFRGADILAYLKAKKNADYQFTLDTNYRSEAKMVEAVNTFFQYKGKSEAFAFAPEKQEEGIEFEPVKSGAKKRMLHTPDRAALQLRWFEDPEQKEGSSKSQVLDFFTDSVCREILDLLRSSTKGESFFYRLDDEGDELRESILPGDIAILVNKHKQAIELKNKLLKYGIPSVIQKSGNVFKTGEAKDFLRFLTAVKNPKLSNLMPLWLCSLFDDSMETIYRQQDSRSLQFLTELTEYQQLWNQLGVLRVFENFMLKHDVERTLLSRPGGERALANLQQCRDILHELEMEEGSGLDGLIRYLSEKIHSEEKEDERYLQRLETDSDAVQILTVHKSKGLEFPIVFCPYLWYETYFESDQGKGENAKYGDFAFYQDDSSGMMRALSMDATHQDRERYRKQWRRERLGEQLRLLYVALTRPVNRCYLYWGAIKNNHNVFNYFSEPTLKGRDILSLDKKDFPSDLLKDKHVWERELGAGSSTSFKTFFKEECEYLDINADSSITLIDPDSSPLIKKNWMVGSYTSLSRSELKSTYFSEDLKLQEDDDSVASNKSEEQDSAEVLTFLRGATFGTALHEVFETIDFQNSEHWKRVIEQKLRKFRLIPSDSEDEVALDRLAACEDMIKRVIDTTLVCPHFQLQFTLCDVSKQQRIDELEFYYLCKSIKKKSLLGLFEQAYQNSEFHVDFISDLGELKYQMEEGVMTGSIDCVVEVDGKYFVIDWKSNHLGNELGHYDLHHMKEKVRTSYYFLQYHIYTVALHLLLKQKLGDAYHYEQHFAGVFYLFIRGMSPSHETGVYFDRIPYELVLGMETLFLEDHS